MAAGGLVTPIAGEPQKGADDAQKKKKKKKKLLPGLLKMLPGSSFVAQEVKDPVLSPQQLSWLLWPEFNPSKSFLSM